MKIIILQFSRLSDIALYTYNLKTLLNGLSLSCCVQDKRECYLPCVPIFQENYVSGILVCAEFKHNVY